MSKYNALTFYISKALCFILYNCTVHKTHVLRGIGIRHGYLDKKLIFILTGNSTIASTWFSTVLLQPLNCTEIKTYLALLFPGKMALTLGFLSRFGFLDVGVPLTDDSDRLLFGLEGASLSLIR